MADNTLITPGVGETIASDELDTLNGAATVAPKPKAQRVKVIVGADGAGVDVSATSPMPVTVAEATSTLTNGRKVSTTPGTAVAIRAALACKWVQVTALTSNTDQVAAGGAGVIGTAGSSTGTPLLPGESVTLPVTDAALVFVDPRVSGEGVSFLVGA